MHHLSVCIGQIQWGANKSLARLIFRCRRTESIVSFYNFAKAHTNKEYRKSKQQQLGITTVLNVQHISDLENTLKLL